MALGAPSAPNGARKRLYRFLTLSSLTLLAATTVAANVAAQPQPTEPQPAEPQPEAAPAPGSASPADSVDAFARARAFYEAGQYAVCAHAFGELLDPSLPQHAQMGGRQGQALLYHGACLLGIGKSKQADERFREAIHRSPQIRPNPLEFPAAVVSRFNAVRQTMLADIRKAEEERAKRAKGRAEKARRATLEQQARLAKLVDLASKEAVEQRNSRWMAAVPFGVGQFQNRSPALGWLFLTTELAAIAVTAGGVAYELELSARYGDPQIDTRDLNDRRRTARMVWTASLYTFFGLAGLGIAEAELSFVPVFRQTRRRELSPDAVPQLPSPQPEPSSQAVTVSPSVVPVAGGLTLGAIGRF